MSILTNRTGFPANRTNDIFDAIADTFFDGFFVQPTNLRNTHPQTKVDHTEEGYTISMAIPGVPKEKVNIDINNNTIMISYDCTELLTSFSAKSLRKSWNLPENVDAERVTASSTDGILTVNIPKFETATTPQRTISVQ